MSDLRSFCRWLQRHFETSEYGELFCGRVASGSHPGFFDTEEGHPVYVRCNFEPGGVGFDYVKGFDVASYEMFTEVETAIAGNRQVKLATCAALRELLNHKAIEYSGFSATGRLLKQRCVSSDGRKSAWMQIAKEEGVTGEYEHSFAYMSQHWFGDASALAAFFTARKVNRDRDHDGEEWY